MLEGKGKEISNMHNKTTRVPFFKVKRDSSVVCLNVKYCRKERCTRKMIPAIQVFTEICLNCLYY